MWTFAVALAKRYPEDSSRVHEWVKRYRLTAPLPATEAEKTIRERFRDQLEKREFLDAEAFIRQELERYGRSLTLSLAYADYLVDEKRDPDGALALLLPLYGTGETHPLLLEGLLRSVTSQEDPNFEQAHPWAKELERFARENVKIPRLLAEYYIRWAWDLDSRSEKDKWKEGHRKAAVGEYSGHARDLLTGVRPWSHRDRFVLARFYLIKHNSENADRELEAALAMNPPLADRRLYSSFKMGTRS